MNILLVYTLLLLNIMHDWDIPLISLIIYNSTKKVNLVKTKKKSNSIDYEQIYRIVSIACICFLTYVIVTFFLTMSNFLTVFLLFGSIVFLLFHLWTKSLFYLICSYVACIACMISSIVIYYILPWLGHSPPTTYY